MFATFRASALLCVVALGASATSAPASPGPAGDPVERAARVESLLVRLTRAEKLSLLGGTGFETRAVPRLAIPSLTMTDGPVGVRWQQSTAFPASIGLAATWDTALVARVAGAIAREARAKGRFMLLGPCINIARVALGGRSFEGFGEDPWLVGRLATSYVRAVQAQGVAATPKHFAANNQEWKRDSIDARIDPRALREIYLPAFQAAVQEGGSWAVMSAYNKLNGLWCSENPGLLHEVLEREWGFDGLVVSDWGAVHSTVPTFGAGLDVETPTGEHFTPEKLAQALDHGEVSASELDDKVRRLLRVLERTGLLDGASRGDTSVVHSPAQVALALEAARGSIVLLKNDRAVLPLDRGRIRSIAVIGPNAAVARTGGGGSSFVSCVDAVSPLDGLRRAAGPGVSVSFSQGVTMPGEVVPIETAALRPKGAPGRRGLRGEYFASMDLNGKPALVRVDSTVDFDWGGDGPAHGLPADHFSARWTGSLVPPVSGSYEVSVRGDDGVRLWLDGRKVLDDWSDHGPRTSTASLELKAGREYRVVFEFYENEGGAMVQLGWRLSGENPLQAAVAAARASDVAVLVVGDSPDIESEGFDRASMALPGGQDRLIHEVVRANPNTVVVIMAGAPVAMGEWLKEVPAVALAWFPGEQGGTAIGEVVFGDVVPGGKLPVSFLRRWEDSSAYPDYPGRDLVAPYADGVFVGYRHLDQAGIEPNFPFGHGLSYTTFGYDSLRVESLGPARDHRVRVWFTIRNTGSRRGAEVAQVYVHDPVSRLPRPPRELKAFARVELEPGRSRQVCLDLDERAFAYFDPERSGWIVEPGAFEIQVGASSRDLRLSRTIELP